MGIITTWLESRASKQSTNPQNPAYWLQKLFGSQATAAGVDVDETNALTFSPVWAANSIISGAVGYLPLHVYERGTDDGRTKNRAIETPAYGLLHDRPNEYMDALTFRQTLQSHALLWGNGYAEIQRNGAGQPVALWPLLPNRVAVKADGDRVVYEVRKPDGMRYATLDDSSVLHIKGLGFDGLKGYSVVHYAAESIAMGMAIEKFGARFFANKAQPGGILLHPGNLSPKAAENLKASAQAEHTGENVHKTMILEEGMTWKQIGIPPEDAQFLESRKFSVVEVARWFSIPPHMLAELERATFSNIEHQGIEFVTWTLMPWLERWEQECNYKLFSPGLRSRYFAEFDTNALLRGDTASRYSAYAVGRQWGWLSVNDIRERENMNPVENGDVYLQPLNMVPAGSEPPEPKPVTPAITQGASEPTPGALQKDIVLSHVGLLADAVRRMRTKEVHAVRRAIGKSDFAEWLPKWYGEHKDTFASAIAPAIASYNRLAGQSLDASRIAADHVQESIRELQDAPAAESVLAAWEADGQSAAQKIIERSTSNV